jgi:hypothetical protein
MEILMNKLPQDVVSYIIPYTYKLQNRLLLDDIVSYTNAKTELLQLYYKFWHTELQIEYPNESINWLINDIYAYANSYNAIMYGYIPEFYNIIRRNRFLSEKTEEELLVYINNLKTKSVMTQIGIFLGLFTSSERNDLINEFRSTYPALLH